MMYDNLDVSKISRIFALLLILFTVVYYFGHDCELILSLISILD